LFAQIVGDLLVLWRIFCYSTWTLLPSLCIRCPGWRAADNKQGKQAGKQTG
tara:strand:+ start:165 stop:317 length:153 start_codon:yes stop_codon:yes gene_type:complete